MRSNPNRTSMCLVVAVLGLAPSAIRSQPLPKPDAARIALLVEQLGDRDYNTREAATRGLIAEGEKALPAVRETLRTTAKLEVSTRAISVESKILAGCCKSRSAKLELAVIHSGTFQMGSPPREYSRKSDESLHAVKLNSHFLLGKHEVTQEDYKTILGTNPSGFSPDGEGKAKVPKEGHLRLPVERVSWYDALEFCNRLGEKDGFEPHYKLEGAKTAEGSIREAKVTVLGGSGYRLPTEAEWEYACRAGTTLRFQFGDYARNKEANFKIIRSGGYGEVAENYALGRTATLGSYPQNAWKLSDMHGNVAEWCQDYYDKDYYAVSPEDDPPGPAKGTHRSVRGGSWMVTDSNSRSASRFSLTPDERKDYVGFRVARTP